MEDRFFFDGIDALTDQPAVDQTVENAALVFSDAADSPVAVLDRAAVAAQKTVNRRRLARDCFIQHCLVQDSSSMPEKFGAEHFLLILWHDPGRVSK
jgi:hypothetical protein